MNDLIGLFPRLVNNELLLPVSKGRVDFDEV